MMQLGRVQFVSKSSTELVQCLTDDRSPLMAKERMMLGYCLVLMLYVPFTALTMMAGWQKGYGMQVVKSQHTAYKSPNFLSPRDCFLNRWRRRVQKEPADLGSLG